MPGVTLNPDPSGDDWAQITAAIATMRTNRLGYVKLEQLSSAVNFNIKKSVDATGLWASEIIFGDGVIVRTDHFTGDGAGRPAPMFDITNSELFTMRSEGDSDVFLQGFDVNSPTGTVKPNCAVLIGNGDGKRLFGMCAAGAFSSASIAVVNSCSTRIIGGGFGNNDANAPTLMFSSRADWGVWSPYSTFGTPGICNDMEVDCELHGEGHQPWTVFLRDVHNGLFTHNLLDNNTRAAVLAQGNNDSITFTSGKLYSELGPPPGGLVGVVECGSPDSCTNLKFVGFSKNGGTLPYTIGSGNFTGLQVI